MGSGDFFPKEILFFSRALSLTGLSLGRALDVDLSKQNVTIKWIMWLCIRILWDSWNLQFKTIDYHFRANPDKFFLVIIMIWDKMIEYTWDHS